MIFLLNVAILADIVFMLWQIGELISINGRKNALREEREETARNGMGWYRVNFARSWDEKLDEVILREKVRYLFYGGMGFIVLFLIRMYFEVITV